MFLGSLGRHGGVSTLWDLTSPAAVESALDEFDELGRGPFLEKYGYGHARRYFVRRNGHYYDSKAIAGAAVGFQYPEDGPLLNTDFTGGEHSVKARLERLGFDVVARPALAAADTLPLREAIEAALTAQQRRTPSQWSDDLQKVVAVQLNRANLSRVFGELMYLFEYRDERSTFGTRKRSACRRTSASSGR